MKLFNTIAVLALALGALACNKTVNEDFNAREQASFDLWMKKYHSEVTQRLDNGMYIQWLRGDGTGTKMKAKEDWMNIRYTARDLDGNVISHRDSATAQYERTFYHFTRYVPHFAIFDSTFMEFSQGEYHALSMMAAGDSVRLFLPSKLGYSSGYSSFSLGYDGWYYSKVNPKNSGDVGYSSFTGKPIIVDLSLDQIVGDPIKYEQQQVAEFARDGGYGSVNDTITEHFYYKYLEEDATAAKIGKDSSVYIKYVCRYLDGTLFKTNQREIAEEAWEMDYGYSSIYPNTTKFTVSSSSIVGTALNKFFSSEEIRYNSKLEMVFVSDWAYGVSGKATAAASSTNGTAPNPVVYSYTPFTIEVTTMPYGYDPDEDEDEEEEEEETP